MNKTQNYQLNQWEAADKVRHQDFNADNAKIDAAIKAVDTKADSKADTSALTAEVQARTALAAQVAQKGNCRLYHAAYTGTGGSGNLSPCSHTFPAPPLMVLIGSPDGIYITALRGARSAYNTSGRYPNDLTWSGSTLSWYAAENGAQMNVEGTTYQIIAFLAADE